MTPKSKDEGSLWGDVRRKTEVKRLNPYWGARPCFVARRGVPLDPSGNRRDRYIPIVLSPIRFVADLGSDTEFGL